jgi:hypothetical protein
MFYKKKPKEIPVQEEIKKVEEPLTYIKFFIKKDGVDVEYKYPYGAEEDFAKLILYIYNQEIQEQCLRNLPKECVAIFHELRSVDRPIIEPIYAFKGKNMNVRD